MSNTSEHVQRTLVLHQFGAIASNCANSFRIQDLFVLRAGPGLPSNVLILVFSDDNSSMAMGMYLCSSTPEIMHSRMIVYIEAKAELRKVHGERLPGRKSATYCPSYWQNTRPCLHP